MKRDKLMMLMLCLLLMTAWGCDKQQIGFMQTQNALYIPNSMDIRLVLDPTLDEYRIYNLAPWVSPMIQGVVGTNPLTYSIVNVISENGNAEMFKSLLTIRGGGRMEFPLISDIPKGEYMVSVRVNNEGHSQVLTDVFTFIVK